LRFVFVYLFFFSRSRNLVPSPLLKAFNNKFFETFSYYSLIAKSYSFKIFFFASLEIMNSFSKSGRFSLTLSNDRHEDWTRDFGLPKLVLTFLTIILLIIFHYEVRIVTILFYRLWANLVVFLWFFRSLGLVFPCGSMWTGCWLIPWTLEMVLDGFWYLFISEVIVEKSFSISLVNFLEKFCNF
jgi:hypothetical protein